MDVFSVLPVRGDVDSTGRETGEGFGGMHDAMIAKPV
jgi:hypothetical protein